MLKRTNPDLLAFPLRIQAVLPTHFTQAAGGRSRSASEADGLRPIELKRRVSSLRTRVAKGGRVNRPGSEMRLSDSGLRKGRNLGRNSFTFASTVCTTDLDSNFLLERMVTLGSMPNGHALAGRQARRLSALLAGLVVVVLAFAGTAEAAGQGSGAQAPGGLTGVLGQVSPQSSQTAQAAVAQAAAVQVQPVNIAITIAVNSPGASPVIVQTNGNSGGAGAGNSSSTTQGAAKPQQAKGKGSSASSSGQNGSGSGGAGGPSQPTQSQTVQGAGAQATAVQFHPVNIATPIAVNSPGASPVIVQTNGNSAGATAANSSS
ncbi:MAG: hypothetical protein ACREJR_12775, partial [Candidatus Rokuibacteriota bacterium]